MVGLSHYIHPSEVEKGDHLYALRGFGFYQHHGIAITAEDAREFDPKLQYLDEIMVVEQNVNGLQIVTLEQFCYEDKKFMKCNHYLRRVKYNSNPLSYEIKRRGSCYIQQALPPKARVENAKIIYTTQREKWSYSVMGRNCEHFAFTCCTGINLLSEQVLAKIDLLTNTFTTLAATGVPFLFSMTRQLMRCVIRIGEKIVPSSIANLTISSVNEIVKNCLQASAITAAAALAVEITILTIRWFVYLWNRNDDEKCEKHLANGTAITTRVYVKCLIQAGIANCASFGMSLAGAAVGAFIPLPGAVVGFSIFFGFLGYIIGRCGSNAIINLLEQAIEKKSEINED